MSYYDDDDYIPSLLFAMFIAEVFFTIACCMCCSGEGLIFIGSLRIIAGLVMAIEYEQFSPLIISIIAGILWINAGLRKQIEERNRAQAILQSARSERREQQVPSENRTTTQRGSRYVSVLTEARLVEEQCHARDGHEDERIVSETGGTTLDIRFGGDAGIRTEAFEICGSADDNLERGMAKFEKFQDTN
mmetsp:Transcript_24795/g.36741  ORF Transcript_24795/g.36741 Transcript_24795/m.36741 type:complete len:190 (+) Transcript_24795:73-642(+)